VAVDANEIAARIVAEAVGDTKPNQGKNPAAVALGRQGGLKGGRARADKMTPEQRSAAAKHAARMRWGTEPRCAVCGQIIPVLKSGRFKGHYPPPGREDLSYQDSDLPKTYCRGSNRIA
jgi:hypothetical protein